MQIKISGEALRKRKLFVATPMYGGQCSGMFAQSVANLTAACKQYGIEIHLHFMFNESLITRARNYCADAFMRSGFTNLMFIDADIGFEPKDVIAMLALQDPDDPSNEYDILAGPYPKKTISWEKVKRAVDKGYGDEDPNQLARFVGDYVFNAVEGQGKMSVDIPAEIQEAGTGFMMIRRRTFERFAEAYPQQLYTPDHVRSKDFAGDRQIMAYFDTPICKETNRYLSEDYMFCRWSRNAGMKVWFCPWMRLQHVGSYIFGGSLADLAMIGANATADTTEMKPKKKK